MSKDFVYGIVIDKKFYSNRMSINIDIANGIYEFDMTQDDFLSTIKSADIDAAIKYFRKASKISIIRGLSFKDSIIPENPVVYQQIPIKVQDAIYDDFEEIEVAILNNICYFLRIISTQKAFPIMDLKEAFENDKKIDGIKGLTPEMRILYTFSYLEREKQRLEEKMEQERIKDAQRKEKLKKELEDPKKYITKFMSESGATVISVKKVNRGFEIEWSSCGHVINTLIDTNFKVIEAGFCTSGGDRTQSVSSVAKLLNDYVEEGSYIHKTRSNNNRW